MSIEFSNILKFFGGGDPSPEEQEQLVKEALVMTLSRAVSSDANIAPCEVETVQAILKRETGDDISAADIRVAAKSELYEKAPLEQYLGNISRRVGEKDRARIARTLAEVIKSDVRVTSREVEFFNRMADALDLSPAALTGLVPDTP